jgi:hypothetical protein
MIDQEGSDKDVAPLVVLPHEEKMLHRCQACGKYYLKLKRHYRRCRVARAMVKMIVQDSKKHGLTFNLRMLQD